MSAAKEQQSIENLKSENARLRTALAEARASSINSATEFMLADAIAADTETLRYTHPIVPARVSVIIPAFNAEKFLERAVRSVWSQTLAADRIELLVIDDGSRDKTWSICQDLVRISPVRMRILQHGGGCNRGVSATRQLGCRESTGEYIALLDADDVYLPDRLRYGVEGLEESAETPAICSLGRNVDMAGNPVLGHSGTSIAGDWLALEDGLTPPFTFAQLWKADPIANSSLTIRRTALKAIGGYPLLMAHQAEDWLLVLKLSILSPIPCIEERLIHYTHHEKAYTTAYSHHGLHEGARIEVFYHTAWWMLRSDQYADAGALFFRQEYPKLIADHHRLLPIVRSYVELGGHAADGLAGIEEYVSRLHDESLAFRRVAEAKSEENRLLRAMVAENAANGTSTSLAIQQELESMRRVLQITAEENRRLRAALERANPPEIPNA
jgi:glycosyltransferase involved in cell wall biosynthesis